MKYSIIIPIYQSENTIKRCLDSLLNQDITDSEILLINDGSSDKSGEICQEYAKRYSCIKYFEKENGGVSSARNFGLDNAMGEYLLFIDSDDYVSTDYFQIIKSTVDSDLDLLSFGITYFGKVNRSVAYDPCSIDGFDHCAEYISERIKENSFNKLMSKVFCKSIVNMYNIRFNEALSIAEDLAFIFSYALHIKKLKVIDECIYFVDESSENSLSRKYRFDLDNQLFDADKYMYDLLGSFDCSVKVKSLYSETIHWMFYRSAYSAIKRILKSDFRRSEKMFLIKRTCGMYSKENIRPRSFKTKLFALPIILGSVLPLFRINSINGK